MITSWFFKININLIIIYNKFISLIKILYLTINLIIKYYIFKKDVIIYNIFIIIEIIIKDI